MPFEKKLEIWRNSQIAITRATREGSKIEKFFVKELATLGIRADYHQIQTLRNVQLHIDLFIRSLKTAIEIDGPTHFKDIRGTESLLKTQQRDKEKTGLILSDGLCLIRVRQEKHLTERSMR